MKKLLIINLSLWAGLSFAAMQDGARLVNFPQSQTIKTKSTKPLTVAVLPIKFTDEMIELQKSRVQQLGKITRAVDPDKLPAKVDLGMNNVPVFNQGEFGTCLTFATTAAIDAALNKGDYISQLCLLQLTHHLGENDYWGSGWNGSSGDQIMTYIMQYGVISKEDQKKGVCNKVTDYPTIRSTSSIEYKMSPDAYHAHSRNILPAASIEPQTIFKIAHMFDHGDPEHWITLSRNSDSWVSPDESLQRMRRSLAEGNRVVIATLLNVNHMLEGRNKAFADTWFVSNELKTAFTNHRFVTAEDATDWGYHALVIYGYDDNATVTVNGVKQKGIFYIRNSWGTQMPSKGVEFMTYDYFKLMSIFGTSINTWKKPS